MKHRYTLALSLLIALTGCRQKELSEAVYNQGLNLIPIPQQVTPQNGRFELTRGTQIALSHDSLHPVANFYAEKMRRSTGLPLEITEAAPSGNLIRLAIDPTVGTSPEAYRLQVTPDSATLTAPTLQGLFYGMATFMQLLPAEIESPETLSNCRWSAPAIDIQDQPRFPYRGLMIDVSRHFVSVDGLKKHIDMLATLKINRLHLHLSDYQGWRVEIKKYPKLTEVGGRRIDEYGNEYSGYYTQDQIRDLVSYAAERFITIIPEIDVPGHSLAAIAAYPELSCTGEQYPVMNRWGPFPVVFCPGKEAMFELLDGVFAELSQLFPSEYFHIGGDECPKEVWKKCPHCQQRIRTEGLYGDAQHPAEHKLQSYAISRCEQILHKYGKKMIGWDEILEGGLAPNATVMSWRGESGGIAAAMMDHPVIMTPTSGGMYLDHYQGDPQVEPFAWGGYAPIRTTYSYDPVPDTLVKMGKANYVLGVQANAWSECMYTEELVEYRVYPRILAVAETGWSDPARKDFNDFSRRLNNAAVRMDLHGLTYHIPLPEQPDGSRNHIAFTDTTSVAFTTSRPMKMVYTLDGSEPGLESPEYRSPLHFDESTTIRIRSVLPSGRMSPVRTVKVERQSFRDARDAEPANPGLKLRFSLKRCLYAKEIDGISEWKDSTLSAIEPIVRLRTNPYRNVEFYVAVAEGYLYIEQDAIYEFTTNNTRAWIGDRIVVDNDGKPQINSKYGRSLALRKGWHPFKVEEITNSIGGWSAQHRNDGSVSIRPAGESKWTKITGDRLRFD